MDTTKRYSIKTIAVFALWSIIATGGIVLLVAAMRKKDAGLCADVKVNIEGVKDNFFVDQKDVKDIIRDVLKADPIGKQIGTFNLKMMETSLEKSTWIRSAELFFDNNNILRVNILEREPVARIFTTTGTTFYIDSSNMMLPLSEKFPARLPVFTSFPSDKIVLSKADSNLLNQVKILSIAIQKDSFRMALIDQIDITAKRNFEMIPKIGDQIIVFGDASDVEEKFNKLKLFYKEVMTKTSWNKYSTINVQFKNQVVAKIKGVEDKTADSLHTLQLMQLMVSNAQQQAGDTLRNALPDNDRSSSTDSSMIQQSMERNEETEGAFIPEDKPAVSNDKPAANIVKPTTKPAVIKPVVINKPVVNKPVVAKPVDKAKPKPITKPAAQKPKATMPRNDY